MQKIKYLVYFMLLMALVSAINSCKKRDLVPRDFVFIDLFDDRCTPFPKKPRLGDKVGAIQIMEFKGYGVNKINMQRSNPHLTCGMEIIAKNLNKSKNVRNEVFDLVRKYIDSKNLNSSKFVERSNSLIVKFKSENTEGKIKILLEEFEDTEFSIKVSVLENYIGK